MRSLVILLMFFILTVQLILGHNEQSKQLFSSIKAEQLDLKAAKKVIYLL